MKKHFIFLGAPGIIYYSWLLALVFVGVTFAYESNKAISIPSIILCSLFGILLIYTWFNSYLEEENKGYLFKLPYRKISEVTTPQLIFQWHIFKLYKLKDNYRKYYLILIEGKRKKSNGI